jgi:hypothetical protein
MKFNHWRTEKKKIRSAMCDILIRELLAIGRFNGLAAEFGDSGSAVVVVARPLFCRLDFVLEPMM